MTENENVISSPSKKPVRFAEKSAGGKIWFLFRVAAAVILTILTVIYAVRGLQVLRSPAEGYTLSGKKGFVRSETAEEEGYDEDSKTCIVEYESADGDIMYVTYSYEEWEALPDGHKVTGYVYETPAGPSVSFLHKASDAEIRSAVRNTYADNSRNTFGYAMAFFFAAIGFFVMIFWDRFFTTYEKCWFLTILVLASVFSILFPEDTVNGISGLWIMGLYLLDTFLNVLCELLISKQSKWNFIVSVFVEITEIVISIVLAYRFVTLATTLFFWLPCDIISFFQWQKHPDKEEAELTEVRTLTGKQEVLLISGIVVWTVVVGYLMTFLDFGTDLFNGNETMFKVMCYLDACVSAVAVANGVFILLRYREQWIAWYIDAILEGVLNVMSGQIVLLVLKLGYLTNTTYGYIKWTQYIKAHPEVLVRGGKRASKKKLQA